MSAVIHSKCPSCKCWRIPESFLNDNNRQLKTCNKCRRKPMIDYKQLAQDRLLDINIYIREIEQLKEEIGNLTSK